MLLFTSFYFSYPSGSDRFFLSSLLSHDNLQQDLSSNRSHDNLRQDLADGRMANPMDRVLDHHTSQEREPAAVPVLPNDQPHQPTKQSHVEDHTEQIEVTSGDDLQFMNPL